MWSVGRGIWSVECAMDKYYIMAIMSYECRHLRGTFCDKRKKECDPGEPGCVLRGRVSFPLKEEAAKQKKLARSKP